MNMLSFDITHARDNFVAKQIKDTDTDEKKLQFFVELKPVLITFFCSNGGF